jgi:hypothetical protein
MKHFENLHLRKKIYFVMSDTRNLLLALLYNISKVVNRRRQKHYSKDDRIVAKN